MNRGVARKCVMLKPNTFFQLKLFVFHNFFLRKTRGNTILEKITLKPGLPGVRLDTPLMKVSDGEINVSKVAGREHSSVTHIIRKTFPCNIYPLIPYFYIAKLGYAGVYLFFLFLLQSIDCGYSLKTCTHNLCFELK